MVIDKRLTLLVPVSEAWLGCCIVLKIRDVSNNELSQAPRQAKDSLYLSVSSLMLFVKNTALFTPKAVQLRATATRIQVGKSKKTTRL